MSSVNQSNTGSSAAIENETGQRISGEISFPTQWTVFGPVDRNSPLLPVSMLLHVPQAVTVDGREIKAVTVTTTRSQYDFQASTGSPTGKFGQATWVFMTLQADRPQQITVGIGWDYWLRAWFNGQPLFDGREITNSKFPPSIHDFQMTLDLQPGANVLALRVAFGKGAPILAVGGPFELRTGDTRSLLEDEFRRQPRWTDLTLQAQPRGKPAVDIGSRRELFVDDHLIDTLTGQVHRRLHHPQPREVVLTFNQPWEGNYGGNFLPVSIVHDEDRWLFYYYAANWSGSEPAWQINYSDARTQPVSCVAITTDGVNFKRPELMLHESRGTRNNNIVWTGLKHLTPFKDTNPAAPGDQRFKAISRHRDGGLSACGSADGIHWRLLSEKPIITKGAFDSQNLAFWDELRGCYVEYHRGQPDGSPRGIMTCTSTDFLNWTEPQSVIYNDDRPEHMYTNCIRPYERAPHLYLGTPARFLSHRTKDPGHAEYGISDAILMSSRDGLRFDRWEEGFIRPGTDLASWTDRNNYPAWGIVQTSSEELSFYWCENNGHANPRLRRGVLRVDGFVSVHAPGHGAGELLTRPLTFTGSKLEVNYATSAAGSMLLELCDESGQPLEGYTLTDCEILYGNEISHIVTWRTCVQNFSHLQGRAIRLRVRMHDADLYAIRFVS